MKWRKKNAQVIYFHVISRLQTAMETTPPLRLTQDDLAPVPLPQGGSGSFSSKGMESEREHVAISSPSPTFREGFEYMVEISPDLSCPQNTKTTGKGLSFDPLELERCLEKKEKMGLLSDQTKNDTGIDKGKEKDQKDASNLPEKQKEDVNFDDIIAAAKNLIG